MLKFILALIITVLVFVGLWFMLSNEFRRAATKYDEKNFKEFGSAMTWVVFYSAMLVRLVMIFQ